MKRLLISTVFLSSVVCAQEKKEAMKNFRPFVGAETSFKAIDAEDADELTYGFGFEARGGIVYDLKPLKIKPYAGLNYTRYSREDEDSSCYDGFEEGDRSCVDTKQDSSIRMLNLSLGTDFLMAVRDDLDIFLGVNFKYGLSTKVEVEIDAVSHDFPELNRSEKFDDDIDSNSFGASFGASYRINPQFSLDGRVGIDFLKLKSDVDESDREKVYTVAVGGSLFL